MSGKGHRLEKVLNSKGFIMLLRMDAIKVVHPFQELARPQKIGHCRRLWLQFQTALLTFAVVKAARIEALSPVVTLPSLHQTPSVLSGESLEQNLTRLVGCRDSSECPGEQICWRRRSAQFEADFQQVGHVLGLKRCNKGPLSWTLCNWLITLSGKPCWT